MRGALLERSDEETWNPNAKEKEITEKHGGNGLLIGLRAPLKLEILTVRSSTLNIGTLSTTVVLIGIGATRCLESPPVGTQQCIYGIWGTGG